MHFSPTLNPSPLDAPLAAGDDFWLYRYLRFKNFLMVTFNWGFRQLCLYAF